MTGSPDADAVRAREASARDDFETAFHHAGIVLALNPQASDMRLLRAEAALALERFEDALSDVGQLLVAQPNDAHVRNLHAQCWLRIGNARKISGNRGAAMVAYQNAARSAPKQVEAFLQLGSLLLEVGNAREALPLLAAVAQDLPDDADLALKLAEAELSCAELDRATARLLEWQSRPSGDAAKRKCAELLLRALRDEAAIQMAAGIARTQPDAWDWCWQFTGHMRAKGDVGAFVLFELRAPSPIRRLRERLLLALAQVSAQPQYHLHWFAECAREDYLRINRACDVMVDSLHWSGGNASLDALHCGLPVVTCPGRYMRGRQSAAMLRALDCAELIAQSSQELAQIAVSVANDPQRRAGLAARIRANLHFLTQSDEPLQALDRALREMLTEPTSA